jgi:hypothetical protein
MAPVLIFQYINGFKKDYIRTDTRADEANKCHGFITALDNVPYVSFTCAGVITLGVEQAEVLSVSCSKDDSVWAEISVLHTQSILPFDIGENGPSILIEASRKRRNIYRKVCRRRHVLRWINISRNFIHPSRAIPIGTVEIWQRLLRLI